MSGWDLATEAGQKNIAEKNSYILLKNKTTTLTHMKKKNPETMEIRKTCQRNKNILFMKLSL